MGCPECHWLHRYVESGIEEPVYELTPAAELVLRFLGDVLSRGSRFIGTESRLKRIIATLQDIVVRGSDDPEQRLAYLRAERQRLDEEIASIEAGDQVAIYSPTAVRERFDAACQDLERLQSEFRAIEESFKQITRNVQQRRIKSQGTRGEILGFALQADAELMANDQGQSFKEFLNLVVSSERQEELAQLVEQLGSLADLAGQTAAVDRFAHSLGNLSQEAEKVLRTTRRLSATLSRLLEQRVSQGRMHVATVLKEIMHLAAARSEGPPQRRFCLDLLTSADIHAPFEHPWWTAPETFKPLAPELPTSDQDDARAYFHDFASLARLDWKQMRQQIFEALKQAEEIELPAFIEQQSLSLGIIEILGYIQLAHDDGHVIDFQQREWLNFLSEPGGERRKLSVPQVRFQRIALPHPLRSGNGVRPPRAEPTAADRDLATVRSTQEPKPVVSSPGRARPQPR